MKNTNLKKNFIWNTIGVMTFSLTSLLYTIILMRFSTLKMTGIFSFGFTLACTTTALAALGGRTYQVTDVKNELSPFTYIISKIFTVSTVSIFILIFLLFRDYSFEKFIVVFLLCIFKYLEELSDVYYGIMQKEDKLYYVGIIQFIKSIVNIIVFLLTIMFLKNLIVSVISIVMVNFLFLLFFEIPIARKLNKWNHSTNRQQLLKYFKVNTTICIFTFLTMCLSNAPKYAIDVYLTDEIQAVFGIIIMPATVMILVCNFITNPILIQIANLYNDKKVKDIFKLFKKIILIIFLIGIFGLFVAYFLGIPFLNIIYSSNFDKYKLELMIIIIGSIFYAISMICSSFLTSIRKISIQLYMNIIFTVLAFIISFPLVKIFGITGGAISYLAVMFIRMLCYMIMTLRKLKGKV